MIGQTYAIVTMEIREDRGLGRKKREEQSLKPPRLGSAPVWHWWLGMSPY
jgi:hypothetical protein